jgi:DNA-directed RNA polymerase I, II, and III subunit RPABC3
MLFEDSFVINAINPEGKKFDRVNRLHATGESFEMHLVLDYNNEIYRLMTNDTIHLLLSSTLALDTSNENSFIDGIPDENTPSLMDKYEYVMHGKVFKIANPPNKGTNMEIYVSFGGLLMQLKGDARNLQRIELDQKLFLLIRKVK